MKLVSSSRSRKMLGLVSASAALTLALAGCSTSSGTPSAGPTKAVSALSAARAFYKGKTITFIVGNAAGSGPATAMSLLRPAMEQYLGATINMTFSAAVPVVSEDQVGTAAPDGLTIGEMSLGAALIDQIAGDGTPSFKLTDASFIGATVQVPDLMVACTNSTYTSMQQFIAGKTPASVVSQKLGQNGLVANYILSAWPVKHTWNFYSNTADQTNGCVRGDGNVNIGNLVNSTDAAGSAMTPGIKPLMLLGSAKGFPGAAVVKGIPTLQEFIAKNPPKTARGKKAASLLASMFTSQSPSWAVFGPPKVPTARVQVLTDAMKAAMADLSVQNAFIAATTPTTFVTPVNVKSFITAQLNDQSTIKSYFP